MEINIIYILPFVGMLLSIAIFPLVKGEWWEKHQLGVAIFWSLLFLVPFIIMYGFEEAGLQLAESIILDYIPFIILLFGLFVVAGGIHIGGTMAGTTANNVVLLAIGTFLASWVGTTGAAMLLIRPVLRANAWRRNKKHIVIFFIFLVANIGGCLTPLGDPPLFLGFLRGVPFFWTLQHIWPLLLLNSIVLLIVFALIDRHFIKKEGQAGKERLELEEEAVERVPIKIEGLQNLIFLAIIILAVILNGVIPQTDMFIAPETAATTGVTYGLTFEIAHEEVHLGIEYFVQIILILIAAALSMVFTSKQIREKNDFEWGPIAEVAKLFIGIFITMIPALMILRASGGSLGIDTPLKFFWATGALSGFLDNSPTYVVFLTTAGSLPISCDTLMQYLASPLCNPDLVSLIQSYTNSGLSVLHTDPNYVPIAYAIMDAGVGLETTAGFVPNSLLLAISAGAVFMGALTYIGNAPNFMVKSIAERSKIDMPSFFGYMAWSFGILIPLFIIDTLVFFL